SLALLAATAASQYVKPGLSRRDIVVLGAVLAAMVAINTSRLILMGWGPTYFKFWHNGDGSIYIAAGQTLLIAALSFAGAHWAARGQT
ncbi:MAG: hypothetical protein KGO94_05120, partial [Alphaproteobacteria bacterium]|nr:hypothetical protein [Alphaproteobacteria bacterium]